MECNAFGTGPDGGWVHPGRGPTRLSDAVGADEGTAERLRARKLSTWRTSRAAVDGGLCNGQAGRKRQHQAGEAESSEKLEADRRDCCVGDGDEPGYGSQGAEVSLEWANG